MSDAFRHHLIARLLDELEREGYALAPDKLLQLQELLRRLPPDLPPDRLRGLLAPLFASSPAQQQRFYELFDQCRRDTEALFAEETATEQKAEEKEKAAAETGEYRWRRVLLLVPPLVAILAGWLWTGNDIAWYDNPGLWLALGVLAAMSWAGWKLLNTWPQRLGYLLPALALGAFGYWLQPPPPLQPLTDTDYFDVQPGDTIRQNLLSLLPPPHDTARLRLAEPRDVVETPLGGRFQVDSTGGATYVAAAEAEVYAEDTVRALLSFAHGTDTVRWIFTYREADTVRVDTSLIEEIDLPHPRDIAELAITEAENENYAFWQQYQWPIKIALLLLLTFLAWAILRWDRYRRAKVVAELQRPGRAPYVWRPDTGAEALDWLAPGLEMLLTRLRGRAPDERPWLDVPATIRATSRRAGRIAFRYRRRTLPADYLLLIDRLAANDHRAHLFDSLYQFFLKAEAPVARYFYDGDPRLCFDEAHPHGLALAELLHRHAGAQLVLIGDGQGLLSPLTGRPAPWTTLLAGWPRRVLLSSRPTNTWGPRERQLEGLLPLLPATPDGLRAAVDLFVSDDPTDTSGLLRGVKDALLQPFTFRHELLDDLRRQFPEPLIDWVAACALWPTLHWNLTLQLGRTLSEHHGQELLTFANVRELTRLPWFAEGRIPDAARERLLDYLAERGLEAPLRASLRELLAQAPAPPDDSVAYDDYRMSLILNELYLKPDPATRRRLEREFAAYLAAGKQPDFVALRLLDRPATRLDNLVGGALKKYAFRQSLPGLGWRLAPRLLGLWVLLVVPLLWFSPNLDPCPGGERVTYNKLELCLNSPDDRLLYLETRAADAIVAQDTQLVDSLRVAADAIRPLDTAFYQNTATRYYNYAARAWNCSRGAGTDCPPITADSLRILACTNFRRGGALAEAFSGRLGIQYYQMMQKTCPTAEAPPPALFSVAGRVFDAVTSRPVVGATVRLGDSDRTTLAQLRAGTGLPVFSTTTDAQGRFAFDSLPAITQLQLYAIAPDYQPLDLRTAPRDELPPLRLRPTDAALEAAAWNQALTADTPEAYNNYLAAFPDGAHAAEARQKLAAIASVREQQAWNTTQQNNTINDYESFLVTYPNGAYAPTARQRLSELRDEAAWQQARQANTPEACRQYLAAFPQGRYAAEARRCAEPPTTTTDLPAPVQALVNSMVRVAGGAFTMGCLNAERDGECDDDEKPPHEVTVPDFAIGRHEVTQAQWRAVMGSDPSYNKNCDQCPVEQVSWNDVQEFLQKLNALTGQRFRLPTEAEWEYAARGGSRSRGYLYSGSNNINEVAWHFENYADGNTFGAEKTTRPVGGKQPNELGLYDMSGNVLEWCQDVWHDNYQGAPTNGSAWLTGGDNSRRVLRGGSWVLKSRYCRSAGRYWIDADYRVSNFGYRLARD